MQTPSVLSSDVHCRACDGTGVFVPLEFHELEHDIAAVLRDFPAPDIMGKGQWFFKPRAIIRILAYMYLKGDIEGRKVACLATPTLAVGLSVLQEQTGIDLSISLLDIDADVLDVTSRRFDSLRVREYDIRTPCPDELRGEFDCFVFDPLYAEDHYRIGLSRCVQLIGSQHPDRVGYLVMPPEEIAPVYKTQGSRSVPIQLSVFRFVNEMGMCIADYKDNFVEYDTPPAEAGIMRHRGQRLLSWDSVGEWRGSDLVRVVSTVDTSPLVEGPVELDIRVNDRRRVGVVRSFVPLQELTSDTAACTLCSRCFTCHPEDRQQRHYSRYWQPEILTRPMPSWRAGDDQPFEVANACVAFEDAQNGEIVILRGPAAKAIWETLVDLEEELGDEINLGDLLSSSLPDYEALDREQVCREVGEFLQCLMDVGLTRTRKIPFG